MFIGWFVKPLGTNTFSDAITQGSAQPYICLFKSGVLESPVGLEMSSGESVTSWTSTIHHGRNPIIIPCIFSFKVWGNQERKRPSQWGQFGIHCRSESKQLLPCILQITVMTDEQHRKLSRWTLKTPPVMVSEVPESCFGPPAKQCVGVEVWGKREELYELLGTWTLALPYI